ncbi:MAG: FecR domain-containing protein [Bauldia sp.]|nr:FecR domain-containing protein [Bauldia sp.]
MTAAFIKLPAAFLLAGAACFSFAGAASAQNIGIAAAISNQVTSPQGTTVIVVNPGDGVVANQVIQTAAESTAQLLFLDQTTLSVGPLAEVTLDRFVFDPSRGTGSVVIEATRGAFRFITGSQAPTNYSIVTPVATMGVLGSTLEWRLFDDGSLLAVNSHGVVTIRLLDGRELSLPNPGTAYLIHPALPPNPIKVEGPFPWPVMLDFLGGNLPLARLMDIEDLDGFISRLDAINEDHAQDAQPPHDSCYPYCDY